MKFEIQKNIFVKTVNDVAKAIRSTAALPILTGIKIVATDKGVTLTGSDSNIYIEAFIPSIENEEELITINKTGSIVLNAKLFNDIVKKMPKDTITLEVNESLQCVITSGKSKFNLQGLDAEEYPRMPKFEKMLSFKMNEMELKTLIQQTVFAVSTSETRPILTGVKWQVKGQRLTCTATDSHRLSERKLQIDKEVEGTFVIPGKSLNELSKILGDTNDVEIAFHTNQAAFKIGNTLFYSRLLEGNYPETSRLIPQDHKTKIVLDRKELEDAIDRALILAKDQGRNNVISLTVDSGQFINISSKAADMGNGSGEEIVAHEVEGDELQIFFSGKYMLDALKSLIGDTVEICFNGAMRPFIIRSTSYENQMQLLLPVRMY